MSALRKCSDFFYSIKIQMSVLLLGQGRCADAKINRPWVFPSKTYDKVQKWTLKEITSFSKAKAWFCLIGFYIC
jgi:hypothetical protein